MATLREQFKQFKNEGTVEQAKQKLRNFYGVTDVSSLVPYLDKEVEEVKELLKPVGPPVPKTAPEQPVTAAKPAKVVAPTPEPEQAPAGLPGAVTPSPEAPDEQVETEVPKTKPSEGLIPYQGTVRVPFLEEVGLISPYKGKETTLELGPSVEKLTGVVGGGLEGTSKYVTTFLEAMASPFTKSLTEKEEDPVRERARQKRLKRVLDVAKAFDQGQADRVKRGEESGFIVRAAEDVKEVLYGLATIFHETVGIQARNASVSRMEAGKQFGEQMGQGLAVITGQTFGAGAKEEPNPFLLGADVLGRSFVDKPLTTVVTVLPIIQAVKGIPGLRGPAVEAAGTAGTTAPSMAATVEAAARAEAGLKGLWQKSKQPIPFNVVSDLVNKVPGVKKTRDFFNTEITLRGKRLLEEPATMETPEQTRIAERVLEEPRIVAGKTQAQTARLGRELARETPTEEVSPFDLTPEEVNVVRRQQEVLEAAQNEPRIGIPDGEGKLNVTDTGDGAAFNVGAEVLGVDPANLNILFEKATRLYERLVIREIPNKAAVMRAGLIELILEEGGNIELINEKFSRNEAPAIMSGMTRSLDRHYRAKQAITNIQDLTTTTTAARPVITEVFEVGGEGIVRQPAARGQLSQAEIAAYESGRQAGYEMVFEGNVTPKQRNIARKELAEAAERKVEVPSRRDKIPTSPSIERVVSYVHKQVAKLFEERAALLPDAALTIEQSPFSRRGLRRRLTQALDQETVSLLRDPKVARRVKKDLARAAKEAGVPLLARRRMLKAFNDFIGDTAAQISNVVFPEFKYNGKTFYGRENILKIFENLPEKVRTQAVEHVTTRVGYEIAAELETIKQVGALNGELNRFVTEQNLASPDIYAVQMATEVVGNGQARPLIMPHNGEQVAASLRASATELGQAISNKTGIAPELATQQVLDLAKYVSGFKPMAKTVGVIERGGIRGLKFPEKLAGSYADPAFNSSVFWDVASKQGFFENQALAFITDIGNMFKRNVVARSTPALVNNNISNTLAVSGRRGVTPPQVMVSLVRFNNRLSNYMRGLKPPPEAPRIQQLRYELIEAMDSEGLFSSNDVRQDFVTEARKGSIPTDIPVEQAKAALDFMNSEVFERMYTRLGDDLFKGEFGFHRGDRAISQLEKTQPGFETRFENNPNSHWRVKKTGPDTYEGTLYDNKTGKSRGNTFTADTTNPAKRAKLMKVIARDGLHYANELFFDYGRVGNWTKMLRALPITNLTSSFHTWFFKALDIPFVKKGLVYKTLLQSDTIPSTDPKVRLSNGRSDALLASRRAIIANSTTGANAQRREQKDVRTPLSFSPSRQELAFVVATTHPDYVLQYALGSRDYTDPTVLGLKALQKLTLAFRDDEARMKELFPPRSKLDKMSDEEWANLQKQRKYFMKTMDGTVLSPKEALELAGVGGSIALNMYDYIRETESQGKVIDLPGVFRNFGKAFFGSNVARLADIAIAGGVEGGVAPDFLQQYTRLGKQEMRRGYRSGQVNPNQSNFLQYAIKEAFGIGWNSIMYIGDLDEVTGRPTTGAMKRYVSGIAAELKANMVKPKQNQARRMKAKADQATDPKQKEYFEAEYQRLSFEAEQIEDAIKTQTELYEDRFEMALNSLYQKSKGIPKPPKK